MSDVFKTLGLNDRLVANVTAMGYEKLTPIQEQAIPAVLAGRDVVGSAQTGTGKTAAFVLPILQRLESHRPQSRVLIVTPTRELAAQVEENIVKYAIGTGITSTVIVGGVAFQPQLSALRRGVDIIVATPGRLLDHLSQGNVFLGKIEVLVLDEMDQMLDMGFVPDVRRIVAGVPPQRQTLLFSATVPDAVAALVRELTRDPVRIAVTSSTRTADRVDMKIVVVPRDQKKAALLAFLGKWERQQLLIFTRTKRGAEGVYYFLQRQGYKVGLIHGDRSQSQRTTALRSFKDKTTDILLATSIAARGLDIPEVSHVLNFDLPNSPEEYIHRVGRTARAEATGEAFTFVMPEQLNELRTIERSLKIQLPREPLPPLPDLPPSPSQPDRPPRPASAPRYGSSPQRPSPQYGSPRRGPAPMPAQRAAPQHAAPVHAPAHAPVAPAPYAPPHAAAPHRPTLAAQPPIPSRPPSSPSAFPTLPPPTTPLADAHGWQIFRRPTPGSAAPAPRATAAPHRPTQPGGSGGAGHRRRRR